jgi:anti-sigma factor RsiW
LNNAMNDRSPDRLDAYLDGELGAGDRAAVEAWLAQDAGARAELETLRAARDAARAARAETPDLDAEWRQLSASLEAPAREETDRRVVPFPVPLGISAIAAALLLGLFVWTFRPVPDGGAGRAEQSFPAELVELVETDLEESSTIVYVDPESGWTVVWIEEVEPHAGPLG